MDEKMRAAMIAGAVTLFLSWVSGVDFFARSQELACALSFSIIAALATYWVFHIHQHDMKWEKGMKDRRYRQRADFIKRGP